MTRLFHSAPYVLIRESDSKRLPLCNAVIAILLFTWSRDQNRGKPRIQNIEITNHGITLQSIVKSPYNHPKHLLQKHVLMPNYPFGQGLVQSGNSKKKFDPFPARLLNLSTDFIVVVFKKSSKTRDTKK
jgi:hypothetical protein